VPRVARDDADLGRGSPNLRWLAARWSAADRHHDLLTATALVLTVVGWSLMWAQALEIVPICPMWVAVGSFIAGLALIPLRDTLAPLPHPTCTGPEQDEAVKTCRQRAPGAIPDRVTRTD